jgi:hypothetical protein
MLVLLIGIAGAVLSYVGSIVAFYISVTAESLLEALFEVLFTNFGRGFRRGAKTWKTVTPQGQDTLEEGDVGRVAKCVVVSRVIGAMNGRRVQMQVSFGDGFYYRRVVIAWVEKPRVREGLPIVTFVICPPGDYVRDCLVQVPDEQLGDFEEVTGQRGVYRLTSVLNLEGVYE